MYLNLIIKNYFFLLLIMNLTFSKNKEPKYIDNELLLSQLTIIDEYKDSTFGLRLGSNDPIEDSFFIQNITLLNQDGIFFAVFDGHGGEKLSNYANLLLYPYFLEAFNTNKFVQDLNQRIIISLNQSFDRIEYEFLKISFNKIRNRTNYIYSFVGSCALASIVINKKIFVANLGDSKARLFYVDENDNKNNNTFLIYNFKKLSKVFNIRKSEEQKRMREEFPKDRDIIKCYRKNACYVKGALQPTKTLGDFSLKYYFFGLRNIRNMNLYDEYKKHFNGPYISSIPDIQVFDLEKNYKYLILGSDGLWDVIKSRDISQLITKYTNKNNNNKFWRNKKYNDIEKISYGLIHSTLINYSKEMKKDSDYNFILETPCGEERRNMHDDITIITCDLSNFN
mgnify:CR=1 FL=1